MNLFPLLELLSTGGLFFGVTFVGGFLLRWMHCVPEDRVERVVWSASIGVSLVGFIILGLGLMGWLYTPILLSVAFFLLLGALLQVRFAVRAFSDLSQWFRSLSLLCKGLCFFITLFLFLNLVHPLAPPLHTGTHYYHLSAPKLFLGEHRIGFLDIIYTNGPFSMQLINLFTLGIANDTVSALTQYGILCLGVLALYSLGRRIEGDRAGLLSSAILLGCRPLKDLMGTSGDMFGLTLYGILAISAYIIWSTSGQEKKWLVLMSIATGLACGVKYLGLGIGLLLTLAVTIECVRGARWKSLGIFCLLSGVIALPWFVKAWVMAGNPIWPFGYSLFGGKNWDADAAASLNEYLLTYGGTSHGWASFLKLPFLAFLGGTSLFLWMFPVAMIMGRPCSRTRRLILYFLAGALLWWCGSQQLRFLLPAQVALFVATAVFLDRILSRVRGRWGVAMAVGLVLLVPVDLSLKAVSDWKIKAEFLCRGADRETYLTDHFVSYRTIRWANEHLPQESVVYVHYYTLQYFFDRPFLPGDYLSQGRFKWWTYQTAEEAFEVLRQAGATHFFIADNIAKRINLNPDVTREFRERYCDLLYHRNGSYLYRIRDVPLPALRKNLLLGTKVEASSVWDHPKIAPEALTDGCSILSSEYTGKWGWGSTGVPSQDRPEVLLLELHSPEVLSEIRVFGYPWHLRTLTDFTLEVFDGSWKTVHQVRDNEEETEWFVRLKPALVEKIRLTISRSLWDRAFLKEIEGYR